jgi:dTDP-L-rhamnose 4-epimerase
VAIFASRLLNRQAPVIFEDGHQIRDFIHVSDLVKANILVMNNQEATGIYNVGSGHPVTIQEIAKSVIDHMDSSLEPEIIDTYRKGDIRHCYADIGRLAALGFKPEYTFEKGIAETVEWVRTQVSSDDFEKMKEDLAKRGLTI